MISLPEHGLVSDPDREPHAWDGRDHISKLPNSAGDFPNKNFMGGKNAMAMVSTAGRPVQVHYD